ncbi:ABC transporter ABCE [Carpediemonas membranifera]|uniref:ABC transporter ABCE n=1 Tax=Carpediemonas membranifera TaxID=201153 RepID=A0A8J6BAF2_9EUKA|nr:ABC transporter ABCE [Carpediemonas membranifera]|eukprot:KAG9393297.1 ABC transporter ABCE [Carpediemonas membranifera]
MSDKLTRIAIVSDACKPKKCGLECKKSCPVVRTGKECIVVDHKVKLAYISESLCVGCGICVKKCPYEAIKIINLPKNLEKDTSHRYGANAFKLHRLPTPRRGQVLGLVGTNGIGKSTALSILGGRLKPNLGRYNDEPSWDDILKRYRGSELQNFLKAVVEEDLKTASKPQYVDKIAKQMPRHPVGETLKRASTSNEHFTTLTETLELTHLLDRTVGQLSGGELQRFAICLISLRDVQVYMYDEPSSYLDIKQRLTAAEVIRDRLSSGSESGADKYIIVVEHDLSVLDYLSDFVCVLYGTPGAYGVITLPYSVREGINVFLAGHIPTENLRFREESLTFKIAEVEDNADLLDAKDRDGIYPMLKKTLGQFSLTVEEGSFSPSEITILLGENGTGKTTFIKLLAGILKPDFVDGVSVAELDEDQNSGMPRLAVSFKPQAITPNFPGTVQELLSTKIPSSFGDTFFHEQVIKPMTIEHLFDHKVKTLSGGELQRVAIVLALGKPANVYLLDEPSAYLDSEQRIIASKVIKRFVMHNRKTAFIVEHDFIMACYLADRVVVYDGQPGVDCTAHTPQTLLTGMNQFLKQIDVSFRRDPTNFRPRVNKKGSQKDEEQKKANQFFYIDNTD